MFKRVAALLLTALWLLPAAADAAVRIAVTAEAMLTGAQITLGDIAVIEGDEPARIAALREIPLGSAPPPGDRVSLSRHLLTSRLAASQTDFSGVDWTPLPEAVSIVRGGQVLSGQNLADIALARLRAKLPARPDAEITVSLLQAIPDLVVPLGVLDYRLAGQNFRFGTPQTAYLLVSADAILCRRVPVRFEAKQFATVVTTTAAIAARETVTPDRVRLSRLEVSRLPAGYLTSPEQAVGLVLKRSLAAGAVIYPSHLNQPILIKRGSAVTIAAAADGVEVTVPGIAQSDGRAGQFISVRNTITGRRLTARVIDKGRVEVAL